MRLRIPPLVAFLFFYAVSTTYGYGASDDFLSIRFLVRPLSIYFGYKYIVPLRTLFSFDRSSLILLVVQFLFFFFGLFSPSPVKSLLLSLDLFVVYLVALRISQTNSSEVVNSLFLSISSFFCFSFVFFVLRDRGFSGFMTASGAIDNGRYLLRLGGNYLHGSEYGFLFSILMFLFLYAKKSGLFGIFSNPVISYSIVSLLYALVVFSGSRNSMLFFPLSLILSELILLCNRGFFLFPSFSIRSSLIVPIVFVLFLSLIFLLPMLDAFMGIFSSFFALISQSLAQKSESIGLYEISSRRIDIYNLLFSNLFDYGLGLGLNSHPISVGGTYFLHVHSAILSSLLCGGIVAFVGFLYLYVSQVLRLISIQSFSPSDICLLRIFLFTIFFSFLDISGIGKSQLSGFFLILGFVYNFRVRSNYVNIPNSIS